MTSVQPLVRVQALEELPRWAKVYLMMAWEAFCASSTSVRSVCVWAYRVVSWYSLPQVDKSAWGLVWLRTGLAWLQRSLVWPWSEIYEVSQGRCIRSWVALWSVRESRWRPRGSAHGRVLWWLRRSCICGVAVWCDCHVESPYSCRQSSQDRAVRGVVFHHSGTMRVCRDIAWLHRGVEPRRAVSVGLRANCGLLHRWLHVVTWGGCVEWRFLWWLRTG